MKLGHQPKCHKLDIYSLSTPWVSKLSLFSLYPQWCPRYGPIFKIAIFGHETCHLPKWQKLHIYTLSTPRSWKWAYFRSTGSGFRDTGRFSKLPYLGMKLGHCPKFQKLHIHVYSLSNPESQISLRFALRLDISKILAILHFAIGHNVKFQFFFKFEISKCL